MKRPPEERERLLRLLRITAAGGLVIVLLGVLAVVGGIFDPSREERASDWLAREYDVDVGLCRSLGGQRVVCDLDSTTRALRQRLGPLTPDAEARVCLFVLENASVVLRGWATGSDDEPCGPERDSST
jgi:hypothetical protein